jgi:Histidine kinase-, DNA gyrase B-, and HSP90-like ATPase
MRQYFNWKSYLVAVALFIVGASIYFTSDLARKLGDEEKKKVEQLADAVKTLAKQPFNQETELATNIITQNTTIPLIITDDKGNIAGFNNIDTEHIQNTDAFLKGKLAEFKAVHPCILADWGTGKDYVYYGDSYLLTQLRYFPYVQLTIICLFLIVVLVAISAAHRSLQNQVWVGLSKETAHQLGTPLSSIEAWLEILKDTEGNELAVIEMQKDLDRLKLVADRFGKVGSVPTLAEENLTARLQDIVAYMQNRSPKKVKITLNCQEEEIPVNISGPLFDWVMENLIRNALDAMAGEGKIDITVMNHPQHVWVDVQDTGKGIPSHQIKKVFAPGFTTKKRGWGLGLSLARRIIEKYHNGSIFVKHSEVGKGTTFRIILRR